MGSGSYPEARLCFAAAKRRRSDAQDSHDEPMPDAPGIACCSSGTVTATPATRCTLLHLPLESSICCVSDAVRLHSEIAAAPSTPGAAPQSTEDFTSWPVHNLMKLYYSELCVQSMDVASLANLYSGTLVLRRSVTSVYFFRHACPRCRSPVPTPGVLQVAGVRKR